MSKKQTPIPKRLKEAREAAGLSQKKLGIMAGMDEFSASARMNQYETGKHTPDYSMLSHIAEVLKLPVSYFYTKDDTLAEVIGTYELLHKKNKKRALNLIKSLITN